MNDINIKKTLRESETHSFESIPKIRVIIRKRPLSKKEQSKNEKDVIDIKENKKVIVKEQKQKVDLTKYMEEHQFIFDIAYNQEATNEQIYLEAVRPMIEAAFNKTKVTCFAYGQTGSGKTYTMIGIKNKIPGLYLLAAYDIFSLLENYSNLSIWVSFYEIYCGKLYDLLNGRKMLTAREDGKQNICIVGLTEKNVDNLNDMMEIIEFGLSSRVVGVTGANADSSRSHGIIQIVLKDENQIQYGKITFIDLAGSERAIDTIDTNKQTKFDGAEINKSLLALKECIRALDQEKKHTPFRGSKLTLVLRDSFIGKCKTLMIGNISPSSSSSEHTLNTLRYADRVKELRARPQNINCSNGDISPKLLKNHQVEGPFNNRMKNKNNKNSRNNSKKSIVVNKSVNICEKKNSNINSVTNLNFYKGRNKNKICSEKTSGKDRLNISGINFFNNIPAIQITQKTVINSNVFENNKKEKEENNNILKTDFANAELNYDKCFNTQKNVVSSILDYNSNDKNEEENKNYEENDLNFNSPKIKKEEEEEKDEVFSDDNSIDYQNINKNIIRTKSGKIGFEFLQKYKSFRNREKEINKKKKVNFDHLNNNEELEELKKRQKKLSINLINEQKKCVEQHKMHIDNLVNLMKTEMNYIDIVEERSNFNAYTEQMIKIFNLEEIKINKIRTKFFELNSMLKEKDEIEKRIKALMEQNDTKDDSTNCLSNINFNSSGSGFSGNNSQLYDIISDNNLSHSMVEDNVGNEK